jgi:hypothetical protein
MAQVGVPLSRFPWLAQAATKQRAIATVSDSLCVTVPDPDHSLDEDRYITVGMSYRSRLLIVAHTERGDHVRIVSARELTHTEREAYERGN